MGNAAFLGTRTPSAPVGYLRAQMITAIGLAVWRAVSLFAARGRLVPRERMWTEVLAADPGSQPAALAVAAARRAAGDREASIAILHACAAASPASCECAEMAASDAVDLGEYVDARAVLERSVACEPCALRVGTLAAAHVGTGDLDGGVSLASALLQKKSDD